MSTFMRYASVAMTVAAFPAFLGNAIAAKSTAAPEASAAVLFLDSSPTTDPSDKDVDGGLLIRELVRQAVLLAARDGLGVTTRDAVLGEFDPKKSPPGLLHIKTRAHLKNL